MALRPDRGAAQAVRRRAAEGEGRGREGRRHEPLRAGRSTHCTSACWPPPLAMRSNEIAPVFDRLALTSAFWPVGGTANMTTPKLRGAALTYARRYGLFTLV